MLNGFAGAGNFVPGIAFTYTTESAFGGFTVPEMLPAWRAITLNRNVMDREADLSTVRFNAFG
jgi:hypothetical protein